MNEQIQNSSPKIAIQTLRSLLYYAERQGQSNDHQLKSLPLNQEQLNSSRLLVDVALYEAQLATLSHLLKDDELGFHIGQEFQPDRWGILGYIAVTSSSIEEALQAQYVYQSLSGNMGTPHKVIENDITHIQWVPSYDCSYHMAEQIITGLVTMARYLTNDQRFSPELVCFTHECMGQAKNYESFFNCPVKFQQDSNEVLVKSKNLNKPLFRSDVELNALLRSRADTLLSELTESSPVDVIRDYVLKTLPTHVPEIEEVASVLNMSSRTLQRKLKEQGLSFSGLLDSIRKELAITYLTQTDGSLLFISQRLGFSEQSAFQRAFKRWTGSTPNHFKQAH